MIKRHLSNRTSSIISLAFAIALVPALIYLLFRLPHFVSVLLNVHEAIGDDGVLATWERTCMLVDTYAMLLVAFAAVALLIVLLRSTLSEKVFFRAHVAHVELAFALLLCGRSFVRLYRVLFYRSPLPDLGGVLSWR